MKKIAAVLTLFCLSPMMAFSAPPVASAPTLRLCTESDIAGGHTLTQLKETPAGDEATWYKQYQSQYLVFHSGQTYDFIASRHPMKKYEDLDKAIEASMADQSRKVEHKYTLDESGLLNLYTDEKIDYSYRCMVVTKAVSPTSQERVGDIVLTGYTNKKTELYKIFRHWP